MICASILFTLTTLGLGVFAAAIPNPKAGCRIRNGAKTLITLTNSATTKLGDLSQSGKARSKAAENTMPIR